MSDPTGDLTPPSKPRFSERIGEVVVPLQVRSMNHSLRSSLWNLVRGIIPPDDLHDWPDDLALAAGAGGSGDPVIDRAPDGLRDLLVKPALKRLEE
jgi:hypothetical protein